MARSAPEFAVGEGMRAVRSTQPSRSVSADPVCGVFPAPGDGAPGRAGRSGAPARGHDQSGVGAGDSGGDRVVWDRWGGPGCLRGRGRCLLSGVGANRGPGGSADCGGDGGCGCGGVRGNVCGRCARRPGGVVGGLGWGCRPRSSPDRDVDPHGVVAHAAGRASGGGLHVRGHRHRDRVHRWAGDRGRAHGRGRPAPGVAAGRGDCAGRMCRHRDGPGLVCPRCPHREQRPSGARLAGAPTSRPCPGRPARGHARPRQHRGD